MGFDEDPLDLLEDDGDGVNEMCLFFDKDDDKQKSQKFPQGTGCGLILICMGTGIFSAGLFVFKMVV